MEKLVENSTTFNRDDERRYGFYEPVIIKKLPTTIDGYN